MWKFITLAVFVLGGIGISILIQTNIQEYINFKVESQKGKIVIVTGANSGLGFYTALSLAEADATVILGCRNLEKCNVAKNDILIQVPNASLDTIQLDLASFTSIRNFATSFREKYESLNVLVNNAGIMAIPKRTLTEDGLESQIGTNHFGHFLLTGLLLPMLSQHSRIINHASLAYLRPVANFTFEDLQSVNNYDPAYAYSNSKLANILFTFELNKRLSAKGKDIISVVVHPGYTATNLATHIKDESNILQMLIGISDQFVAMSGPVGAQSQIAG